ncbi:hypothetical protein RN001_007307 [Aquatica leii]|uniref:Reverse transcriptase n=1 Tax=Aquatica leii TaxID=1421715 RepID=A0AAN7PBH7_9COLE|nr:hypothetical protein RN001_007307 [Aquatica leii]
MRKNLTSILGILQADTIKHNEVKIKVSNEYIRRAELEALDRKTRKIMTINHSLHPQSDVNSLYLPRKIGGRGLRQVKDETVDHIISSCLKIAQTDYLARHDKVATMLHWNICKNYNLLARKYWWDHQPEKIENTVQIIDVAIPRDTRISEKELEKKTKYRGLEIEIEKLWRKKTKTIPIIIGWVQSQKIWDNTLQPLA